MERANIALFGDLTITVGDRTLLDEQTLSIEPGTITVMMGPSGVGKSILADVAFGFEERHGALRTDGDVGECRAHGALVFQEGGGLEHLTVLDNLLLVSSDRQACLMLAEQFEIDPRKLGIHLSGGERRRLAIARSLLAKRRLLWLDEPDTGLDPARLRDLASVLKTRVAKLDLGMVVITHNLMFAQEIADRILYLHPDGRFSDAESFDSSFPVPVASPPRWWSRVRRPFASVNLVDWTQLVATSLLFALESIHHRQARLTFFHALMLTSRSFLYYPLIAVVFGAIFLIIFIRSAPPLFDAVALTREFGPEIVLRVSPPMAAILVASCAGSTIAAWIGQMTVGRQLDTLLVLGVPMLRRVLGPILWALCATTIFSTLTFSASIGSVFGIYVQVMDGSTAAGDYWFAFSEEDSLVLLSLLKAVGYGFLIGGITLGSAAASTLRSSGDVGAAVTRGIVCSTAAIMLVELVVAGVGGWTLT